MGLLQRLRQWLLPRIGNVLAEVNEAWDTDFYVTATTNKKEYVGVVNKSLVEFEKDLAGMGFVPNPVAAFKTLQGTEETEVGSYAWRGDPASFKGTIPPSNPSADRQLHVVCFELDEKENTTAIFAHWEYNWQTHPIKHYRGHENDDNRGVNLMRRFLNLHYGPKSYRLMVARPPLDTLTDK